MIKVDGIYEVLAALDPKTFKKQVDYAQVGALNNLVFWSKEAAYKEMERVFAPVKKSYTLRSLHITKATNAKRKAILALRTDAPSKGRAFDEVLGHLFTGGRRTDKRMERALIAKGWMHKGQIAVPTEHVPKDMNGNPRKSFIIKVMSFLRLFGEQGYNANINDDDRAKKIGKKRVGGYMKITKKEWFISRGEGTMRRIRGGRRAMQTLPAGIWQKSGTHGAVIKPLFLFVDQKGYRQFIDLKKIVDKVIEERKDEAFEEALRHALKTARWKI